MAKSKTTPERVTVPPISKLEYDLVAGRLRCVMRLAHGKSSGTIKAVWRNEVGPADCAEQSF